MEYLPYFHGNQAAGLRLAQGLPLLIKLGYSGGTFYNLKPYILFTLVSTCAQKFSETHSNFILHTWLLYGFLVIR